MSFRKILYLHEEPGARWALDVALDFAGRVGARVTLASSVEDVSPALLAAAGMEASGLQELAAAQGRQELEAVWQASRRSAPPVALRLLRGRPFMAVIREVLREPHDLVMLAAPESVAGSPRPGLSSTAMHLVRKCPVPVWVLRASSRNVRRIGVAVDAEPEGERSALDHALVQAGAAVARACAARLDVLHVLHLHPSEDVLRHRAGVDETRIAAIRAKARARVEGRLRELVAGLGVPTETHVLEGRPAQEIPRFATRAPLDLLVMGTVGRSRIAGLLIGNTAEEIVQRVDCSLLALKPAGFVTPVQ